MLRVLQIGKYYRPVKGGMETHLEQLCQGLRPHVDLQVLVSHAGKETCEEDVDGVRVKRLGTLAKVLGAPFCRGLRRGINSSKADIVHIHLPNPTALLAYLLSRTKAKLVITYHSDIVRQRISQVLIAPMQERALRRAGALLVSSPNLIEYSPILQRHRARCRVVPFGIPRQSMDARAITPAIKRVQSLTHGKPLLLAVGRLVYYKGFAVLIEAVASIPNVNLVLVGEGPLRGHLEQQIEALGLHDRVHLVGEVEETTAYYEACDVFVLPSIARSEAFGLVQLEAMARGKPVINTSLLSGVPFVSLHGKTGLTVPPGDVGALAQAIRDLINNDALRFRLGEAARRRTEDHFTVDQMTNVTLDIYRALYSNSPLSLSSGSKGSNGRCTQRLQKGTM